MSNRPEDDPIGHAAKFLWLWSALPVIFGVIPFFLPPRAADSEGEWKRFIPFGVAGLIALIGLGVWRRIVAATWAGMALFSVGLVGLVVGAFVGGEKKPAMAIIGMLLIWPIIKLKNAMTAMQNTKSASP